MIELDSTPRTKKGESTKRYLKQCSCCGEDFHAKIRHAKYCSKQCRWDASNAAQAERRDDNSWRAMIKCSWCGVKFTPASLKYRRMKYCCERCKNSARSRRELGDPIRLVRRRSRYRIWKILKLRGHTKDAVTTEILGCDYQTLKRHIERQFAKGMTWNNKDRWHIDHIVPLATARTKDDVARLSHYTNLMPLWAKDNLSKGARPEYLL